MIEEAVGDEFAEQLEEGEGEKSESLESSPESDEVEAVEVELSETEQLILKVEQAEAKAAEYLDGWQRARAEFANAKKRLERERAEAYRNASVDYVSKLLPVIDDFERAIANSPEDITKNPWSEGLVLVLRKLASIMEGLNVERIDAIGQPFDPNFHEALTLLEAEGVESGIVVEELQKGYRLGDRVIRPSLVKVAA